MYLKQEEIVCLFVTICCVLIHIWFPSESNRTRTVSVCVWNWLIWTTMNHVHCNKATCHLLQQWGSLMCFYQVFDNNRALWHGGIRYIRICVYWQHLLVACCFGLFYGICWQYEKHWISSVFWGNVLICFF